MSALREDSDAGEYEVMSEEVALSCRWSEKDCVFFKESGKEPSAAECMLCFANAFKTCSEYFARVLASVGAGKLSGGFLRVYDDFCGVERDFYKAVEDLFPWITEEMKKRRSGMLKDAIIALPIGIPFSKALVELRKRAEKGEIPMELVEEIERRYKEGGGKSIA